MVRFHKTRSMLKIHKASELIHMISCDGSEASISRLDAFCETIETDQVKVNSRWIYARVFNKSYFADMSFPNKEIACMSFLYAIQLVYKKPIFFMRLTYMDYPNNRVKQQDEEDTADGNVHCFICPAIQQADGRKSVCQLTPQ